MTSQLAAQRGELMEANRQIDERRRFTETVLSGVSAGVIGLDARGPDQPAEPLRLASCWASTSTPRSACRWPSVAPEFAAAARRGARPRPTAPRTAEITIGPPARRRTLLARIGAELQRRARRRLRA